MAWNIINGENVQGNLKVAAINTRSDTPSGPCRSLIFLLILKLLFHG
jgi:hypothetical protein